MPRCQEEEKVEVPRGPWRPETPPSLLGESWLGSGPGLAPGGFWGGECHHRWWAWLHLGPFTSCVTSDRLPSLSEFSSGVGNRK